MDRICSQSPSSTAKWLKHSFTKLMKVRRSSVEKEKKRRKEKKEGITKRKRKKVQYPLSPDLRHIRGNGESWYIKS